MKHLSLFVLVLSTAALATPFTEPAKFERWSHFYDYGIPGTAKDPVGQAAITDGSCRMLGIPFDGYHFWQYPTRVKRVLTAFKSAPPTSMPSHFVLTTNALLTEACTNNSTAAVNTTLPAQTVHSSVQNWYHALCCPATDPSWTDGYDPAYQPQQFTLTFGFGCIAGCEAIGGTIDAKSMMALGNAPDELNQRLCKSLPWGSVDFSKTRNNADFTNKMRPWLSLCGCKYTK